jgi:hypothetical protein
MSSPGSRARICDLSPELFAVIASHIPSTTRPPTLISLAMTNHFNAQMIIPFLLYQNIIIHCEERLLSALDTLSRDPLLRSAVRGIYIRTALSIDTHGEYTTLSRMMQLFELGGLTGVHTVNLILGPRTKPFAYLNPFECLYDAFWISLSKCCPRIQNLSLDHCVGPPYSARSRRWIWDRHSYLFSFKVRSPGHCWPALYPLKLPCSSCSARHQSNLDTLAIHRIRSGRLVALYWCAFGPARGAPPLAQDS